MSHDPLVTVVTPSFNQADFIERTIQSVLSQDYSPIEYIVMDGGSTDGTLEILKKYEGRLTWFSEKDRGQADAVNKGWSRAKGSILGWLNSDDTYAPGAIRKVVDFMARHPDAGMVYGDACYIDAEDGLIEPYFTEPFSLDRLAENCFICQPAAFLRADVFRTVGPLDISLNFALDYEYWIRIAKSFPVRKMDDPLANSRLHGACKSVSQRRQTHGEAIAVVRKYFGDVPLSWIYGYARDLASSKLTCHLEGAHSDGWASQRLAVSNAPSGRLMIEGDSPTNLKIRILVNDRFAWESEVSEGHFIIEGPLASEEEALSLTVVSDRSFIPDGETPPGRKVSFRLRKIAIDHKVIYSPWRAAASRLLLPAIYAPIFLALRMRRFVEKR